jgi:hypothetical protein
MWLSLHTTACITGNKLLHNTGLKLLNLPSSAEAPVGTAGSFLFLFFLSTWPWQFSHSSSEDDELSSNARGFSN